MPERWLARIVSRPARGSAQHGRALESREAGLRRREAAGTQCTLPSARLERDHRIGQGLRLRSGSAESPVRDVQRGSSPHPRWAPPRPGHRPARSAERRRRWCSRPAAPRPPDSSSIRHGRSRRRAPRRCRETCSSRSPDRGPTRARSSPRRRTDGRDGASILRCGRAGATRPASSTATPRSGHRARTPRPCRRRTRPRTAP